MLNKPTMSSMPYKGNTFIIITKILTLLSRAFVGYKSETGLMPLRIMSVIETPLQMIFTKYK